MTFYVEYDTGAGEEELFDIEELFEKSAVQSLVFTGCPYECEADLTITDDEGIRALNKEYRGIDAPTDVLSFPLLEFERAGDYENISDRSAGDFDPETGELMLGSVVINMTRAKEQAKLYGHSLKREVAFLIVHSMLHLQGFDHMEDEERTAMEKAQSEILKELDIPRGGSF